MNATQTLRTAFWSLTVGLGLLLLLVVLRPEVTDAVTSIGRSINRTDAGESRFHGYAAEGTIPGRLIDDHHVSALTATAVEPANVLDAPQQSAASINRELNARLASLQTAVERLQQTDSDRRVNELERAAQQLKQTQQSQRLRELELQLHRLQSPVRSADAETTTAAADTTRPEIMKKRSEAPIDAAADRKRDRFSLQIRHAEITEVLELLGQTTGYNILIGEGVSGTVPSANLRNVTIVEALDSIVHSLGLVFEQDGQFIYVTTKSEQTAGKSGAAKASAARGGPDAR